jgi:hypothetical protein
MNSEIPTPNRGDRIVFRHNNSGDIHAAVITRVSDRAVDLTVFAKGFPSQPRISIQHVSRADESGAVFAWDFPAKDFDWPSMAA